MNTIRRYLFILVLLVVSESARAQVASDAFRITCEKKSQPDIEISRVRYPAGCRVTSKKRLITKVIYETQDSLLGCDEEFKSQIKQLRKEKYNCD